MAGEILTPNEIYSLCAATWPGDWRNVDQGDLDTMRKLASVACAESAGIVDKRGDIDPDDRGLFQINRRWHPGVSDAQADNPIEAARYAWRLARADGSGITTNTWHAYPARSTPFLGVIGTPAGDLPLRTGHPRYPVTWGGDGDDDGGLLGDVIRAGPIDDVVGAGLDAVGAAEGVVDTFTEWGDAFVALVRRILDPRTWIRVVQIAGGLGLIAAGFYVVANDLGWDLPKPPLPVPS